MAVPMFGTLLGFGSQVIRGMLFGAPIGLFLGFIGSSVILMNPPIFWQLTVLGTVLGAHLGALVGILGGMITAWLRRRAGSGR
jgi:hypothetical protein